jgi:hypothetical protein
MRLNFYQLLILMLVSICMGMLGCGKKAPPAVPQEKPVPAVKDLRGHREGDRVVLSWHLPGDGRWHTVQLGGFRVYRSKSALDGKECAGCPVRFEAVAAIPLKGTDTSGTKSKPLKYTEKIDKGYRYVYKVTGMGLRARESRPSNLIELVY